MDFNARMKEVISWLTNEYGGIRSGQASPAILDGVRVDSYGSKVPLNQVGSIGIEDARTLRVSVWNAGSVKDVETAIKESALGVSVSSDSSGVRVIFPELTSERRTQLIKLAKQKLEDARVSVRSIRDEVMKELDKQEKDGDLSEDEKFTKKETIQKGVETTNTALEQLYKNKEVEISK